MYNIEFNYIHNYGSTISSDYGGIYIGGGGVNITTDNSKTLLQALTFLAGLQKWKCRRNGEALLHSRAHLQQLDRNRMFNLFKVFKIYHKQIKNDRRSTGGMFQQKETKRRKRRPKCSQDAINNHRRNH